MPGETESKISMLARLDDDGDGDDDDDDDDYDEHSTGSTLCWIIFQHRSL